MSSPENALVQADKSKIDDGHPSGQNDWGVAALFNMITPHFFEYHRYSSSIRIEDVQNQGQATGMDGTLRHCSLKIKNQ